MCCKIDLNSKADVAHFLGKTKPNILPQTADNVACGVVYADEPAKSLWDNIKTYLSRHKSTKSPQKD